MKTLAYVFKMYLLTAGLGTAIAAGAPPEAPPNLTGSITGSTVSLQWDVPVDDDTVEGYNVYINNLYVDTVAGTSYNGTIDASALSSFYVVAFDTSPRRFSPASEQITLPENLIPDDLTIPPSAPTALTGAIDNGVFNIQWVASTDDEAVQGYNVYQDNQYLTTVAEPSYSGLNSADESHSWYVVAFDIRNNFSQRSESIRLPDTGPVDTTIPPSIPSGLTGNVIRGTEQDTVTFSWEPATDDQAVAGYNVYRNGDYLATRFTTNFTNQVNSGSSNFFQVVSFDFDNNFSGLSERITLPQGSAPANPGIPPSVPRGLAVNSSNSNGQTLASLTWEPSTGPVTVTGYNVYRNNAYLTTVRTNSFTDSVNSGAGISYSVVAFDEFENYSSRSERISLTSSLNQPPFFSSLQNQQLRVGELWELLLNPVDIEGDPVGILVNDPPTGIRNVDNLNATRTLQWTPSINDVGIYAVTIIAFDVNNVNERTEQTIQLTVSNDAPSEQPAFSISVAQSAFNLIEGSSAGIDIPLTLNRNGSTDPITLSVETVTPDDNENLTTVFSNDTLANGDTQSTLSVRLAIGVLPLIPEQRRLNIRASDGAQTSETTVSLAVTPTANEDVYLLIGQSNMVGISEFNVKQAGPGQPDQPNPRIRQANVTANSDTRFISGDNFSDVDNNFSTPRFTIAEDPLHKPLENNSTFKAGTQIGMGLSFAKSALLQTSSSIVLVPSAWSGSAFCNDNSLNGHWNAVTSSNPSLGNTFLFDRALARLNETLLQTGGIFRGILWHQGESDSNSNCAGIYADNLKLMVSEFRKRARLDARGPSARGETANIPFVAGTMSRGQRAGSDFSFFDSDKTIVDNVHKSIDSVIPFSAITNNDDLVPSNGFPCSDSCIHFGANALREMGARYYQSLLRAANN